MKSIRKLSYIIEKNTSVYESDFVVESLIFIYTVPSSNWRTLYYGECVCFTPPPHLLKKYTQLSKEIVKVEEKKDDK
jgi:hypothetical protein